MDGYARVQLPMRPATHSGMVSTGAQRTTKSRVASPRNSARWCKGAQNFLQTLQMAREGAAFISASIQERTASGCRRTSILHMPTRWPRTGRSLWTVDAPQATSAVAASCGLFVASASTSPSAATGARNATALRSALRASAGRPSTNEGAMSSAPAIHGSARAARRRRWRDGSTVASRTWEARPAATASVRAASRANALPAWSSWIRCSSPGSSFMSRPTVRSLRRRSDGPSREISSIRGLLAGTIAHSPALAREKGDPSPQLSCRVART